MDCYSALHTVDDILAIISLANYVYALHRRLINYAAERIVTAEIINKTVFTANTDGKFLFYWRLRAFQRGEGG